jgi:hypothetical protein
MSMRISSEFVFLAVLLVAGQRAHAARIDPSTRNHSRSRDSVLVAENGTAKLPVIVASTNAEALALARALTNGLDKITGGNFDLIVGGAGPGIFVGTVHEFPTPSAAKGLEIYDTYDGREAFAIRTEDGSIKLLGATAFGVSHAVFRFLELLGCRWFFQGPAWEVVPRTATVRFDINETDRPEVLARSFGYPRGDHFEKTDPPAGEALYAWWRHNRVGKSFQASVGHCYHEIVGRFQTEFEAHPEYRALPEKGAQRSGEGKTGKEFSRWGQLCISNPRVIELAIQYANEYFNKHPDADMVGVGPDDGGGYCVCDECVKKFGDPGIQAFYLANQVAKALQESHPGKLAGLLAYNWHCDPPPFRLEPNVYVELTTAMLLNTKYGFDELLNLWPAKCRHFGLYDYWAVYDWIRDRLPSGRTGDLGYVGGRVPFYMKHGICALNAESGTSWGSQGLGYYLASRVLWNSSADIEALKNDFYEKAFGPAALAMKTYYERVDKANHPLVGPSFYRQCLDDLEAAGKAAAGQPDVMARIELLKEYHVFVYLKGRVAAAGLAAEEKKTRALEMLRWNYLVRNTYMTFWDFFCGQTTVQLADEFNEPSWKWYAMRNTGKADEIPYRDTRAAAADETGAWFEKMKVAYGEALSVADVPFSSCLVAPTNLPAPTKPRKPLLFRLQGPYCLALASRQGEPLHFTIQHGTIYQKMADGKYVLSDCRGQTISEGRMPHGTNSLALRVPAPGVYLFRYDDCEAGSALTLPDTMRAAFVLERGSRLPVYNQSSFCFYVPQGTRTIQLYVSRKEPIGICQPDGEWVGEDLGKRNVYAGYGRNAPRSIEGNGAYRSIPVPPGMDGKLWTAANWINGSFHFFNLPNLLLVSADSILLPEDVARREELPPP